MKAIRADPPGGPEQLRAVDVEIPQPGPDEVLVRIHATALNRADILQRQGRYDPPKGVTDILGLEGAGIVAAPGSNVDRWKTGDRVFGLLAGGGYAEYAVFPNGHLMEMPEHLSFEEAAAIPEAFLTAFQALVLIGRLQAGETVLIHAGASGVGTAAIQVARASGVTPLVTASRPKHDLCLSLGAAHAIDYKHQQFDDEVLRLTGGTGAHLIVDFIGAPYLVQNIRAAAVDGRLVLLALMGGAEVPDFRLGSLFRKRLSITASTLRNRALGYKTDLVRRFEEAVLPRIAAGEISPVIDSRFNFERVSDAHRRMESNLNAGKIVLTLIEGSARF